MLWVQVLHLQPISLMAELWPFKPKTQVRFLYRAKGYSSIGRILVFKINNVGSNPATRDINLYPVVQLVERYIANVKI